MSDSIDDDIYNYNPDNDPNADLGQDVEVEYLAHQDEEPDVLDPDRIRWLEVGEEFEITKYDPTIRKIRVGLGWEVRNFEGERVDMDASCFLLNKDGITRKNEDFVFYNNPASENNYAVHDGDNRTGAGDGDDESLTIDLYDMPLDVLEVAFSVSIYQGFLKGQNFSQVRDVFIRIAKEYNGEEMCRFNIGKAVNDESVTGLVVAKLIREGAVWIFKPLAEHYPKGLSEIATQYAIVVQE